MADNEFITFTYEGLHIADFDEKRIRQWIQIVAEKESATISYLHVIFCSDLMLLELNKKYLNHDTFTDIITFNYTDEFDGIAGDLFISYDRVKENAITHNVDAMNEFSRVIIHGVLHLLGYNDTTGDEREEMRAKENYYLNLLS